jgi:hypothetical protein
MQNTSDITISVHLHSGDPIVFRLDATEDRKMNAASRIEQSMKANYMGVDLDGKLVLIPTSSIQKIEISPAPEVMIANVVRGAKSV